MVCMKRSTRIVPAALLLLGLAQASCAQTPASQVAPEVPAADAGPVATALDAELFYQLLLGEISDWRGGIALTAAGDGSFTAALDLKLD